jgi:type IV secretion system protein VirD4
MVLLGCLIVGMQAATQYVAWGFGFHVNLGPPALVFPPGSEIPLRAGAVLLGGGALAFLFVPKARRWTAPLFVLSAASAALSIFPALYAPSRYVSWAIAYGGLADVSPYAALFRGGLLTGGAASVAVLAAALLFRRSVGMLPETGSHGTAAWSDGAPLVGEKGLLIGRRISGKKAASRLLRYNGEGHLVTMAPTRSGKGTGSVIPNLLSHEGSVVVTDPKGENWAVTARCRREYLGQRAVALDPFDQLSAYGLPPSEAAFNPMDLVEDENLLEGAWLLADMLVLPSGKQGGEEHFWEEEAKALLAGLILHVATSEVDAEGCPTEVRTLLRVRELLTLPKKGFTELMTGMLRTPAAGGLVARAAARHLQKEYRERSGVVSTAQSQTHFLDSPRMAEVLGRSSFDLTRLKTGRLSLYLILPVHHLDTYARWLRLLIASALDVLSRTPGGGANRTLFLLDEFANLGRMNPVLRAVSLMAGYGAQLWMFLQDLSQLKGTYPDRWSTFLANADVFQAFSTGDHDTARYLSDLTGDATIFSQSASENRSRSAGKHTSRQHGAGQTYAERGRRLLLPDEVRRLPSEEQLLFVKGMHPVRARKINYLEDADFKNSYGESLFDKNPMFAAVDDGQA